MTSDTTGTLIPSRRHRTKSEGWPTPRFDKAVDGELWSQMPMPRWEELQAPLNAKVDDPMRRTRLRVAAHNILTELAVRQRCMTYRDLARELFLPLEGNQMGRCMALILDDIYNREVHVEQYDRDNCAPAYVSFTCLIVRSTGADQGCPGPGFWVLDQALRGDGRALIPEAKRELTALYHRRVFKRFEMLRS